MKPKFFEHAQHRSAFTWLLIAGFFVAILNWPQERVRLHFWKTGISAEQNTFPPLRSLSERESLGQFIGWPISLPLISETDIPLSRWLIAIAGNAFVMIGVSATAAMVSFMLFTFGRLWDRTATPDDRRISRFMISLNLIVCCCFSGIGIRFFQQASKEAKLTEELRAFGDVQLVAEFPAFIAQRLPRNFFSPFYQIEGIRLLSPPAELLERAQRITSLRSINLAGITLDGELYAKLICNSSIRSLRLSGSLLSGCAGSKLTRNSQIESLTLDRCVGAEAIVPSLKYMTKLRSFDGGRSPIRQAQALIDSLPNELKELRLALEGSDQKRLTLKGLASLKLLSVIQSNPAGSGTVIAIELLDLGQLSQVSVSPSQIIDLTANNVPRLQSINIRTRFRNLMPDDSVFNSLPIRKLNINQAPGLQELDLNAVCLESLSLQGTPNLHRLSIIPYARKEYQDLVSFQSCLQSKSNRQATTATLVADIAKCDGPTSLDLSGIQLSETDISQLENNVRIQELILVNTGVEAEQLVSIEHRERIKSLNLAQCKLDDVGLNAILAAYPGIERLWVELSDVENLEIDNQPNLEQLFGSSMPSARRVKIIGCPKLSGSLMLGDKLETLEIRDAKSLTTLVVSGQIPANSILEGFRDLTRVELVGSNVKEQHFESLLNCRSIRELTLQLTSISAKSLHELSRFDQLSILNLHGADITDDVVLKWGELNQLREVDLSSTKITGNALHALSQTSNIQRLNINDTRIRTDDLGAIFLMRDLIELEIAGIGINSEFLRRCLLPAMIECIDLSKCAITNELVDMLASESASHLLFVGLNGCGLHDDQLLRIANAHPYLAMDISGNFASASVINQLSSAGRLIACDDRLALERWIARVAGFQPSLDI